MSRPHSLTGTCKHHDEDVIPAAGSGIEYAAGPMVSGDTESSPIPVTVKVAGACKVGWDVVGVLALSNRGWRLIEVWNISP